jgi:ABC-2 type transport system permease protein
MIAGLIYILGFEGLLASWLGGLRYISIGFFGRRVTGALSEDLTLVSRDINLAYVVIALIVVSLGGMILAGHQLRSFQLRGED